MLCLPPFELVPPDPVSCRGQASTFAGDRGVAVIVDDTRSESP